MLRFEVRCGKAAVFAAAITLGMLAPTRMAFAQG